MKRSALHRKTELARATMKRTGAKGVKRSPLKAGAKSVERGSTFASRGDGLKRSAPTATTARGRRRVRRIAEFVSEQLREPETAPRCFCGCGKSKPGSLQLHHVVYQQELRRVVRTSQRGGPPDMAREMRLTGDRRNLVPVGHKCHAAHHNGSRRYELRRLPDSVYEFAAETLGALRAYEYLKRRYAGDDPRLEALLGGPAETGENA